MKKLDEITAYTTAIFILFAGLLMIYLLFSQ